MRRSSRLQPVRLRVLSMPELTGQIFDGSLVQRRPTDAVTLVDKWVSRLDRMLIRAATTRSSANRSSPGSALASSRWRTRSSSCATRATRVSSSATWARFADNGADARSSSAPPATATARARPRRSASSPTSSARASYSATARRATTSITPTASAGSASATRVTVRRRNWPG